MRIVAAIPSAIAPATSLGVVVAVSIDQLILCGCY